MGQCRARLASAAVAAVLAGFLAGAQPALASGQLGGAAPSIAPQAAARAISALATANVGKHACSRNSLGGRAYGSSCTGNGGLPEYWCADFVRWVWEHEGVVGARLVTPAAGSVYTYGLRFGTLSAMPAVGDAAVFNYYGGGVAEHVAIVTAVHSDGSIETVSGDWGGDGGSEAAFASTSTVTLNSPFYPGVLGSYPGPMGMDVSAFVAPAGVGVSPVPPSTSLAAGGRLSADQALTSPNGTFALRMQADGNLVEYAGGRPVWWTGTEKKGGTRALMQGDGNLVVYGSSGGAVWSTGTGRHSPDGFRLVLDDYGRLSIVGARGRLWTHQAYDDALSAGERLVSGARLVSRNGLYDLVMQSDGNLVEQTAGRPIWSTNTGGHRGAFALLQRGSALVVYTRGGRPLWASGRCGRAGHFVLVLGPSATLTIYGRHGPLWSRAPFR